MVSLGKTSRNGGVFTLLWCCLQVPWFIFAAVVLFQASRCTKPRPCGRAWGSESDPAAPAVSPGRPFHQGLGIPNSWLDGETG